MRTTTVRLVTLAIFISLRLIGVCSRPFIGERLKITSQILMFAFLIHGGAIFAFSRTIAEPRTVIVRSGALALRALLWCPRGRGPFPAVMFNHGSGHARGIDSAGRADQRHPELLAPIFVKRGYVFFYLFRRGDGLSAGQGTPSGDLMDREFAANGQAARNQLQLRLLEKDEMDDVLAGLTLLRTLPEVDSNRIALAGHSFGGTLTVLAGERDSTLRAIVVFSGSGNSWDRSPGLRARLLAAVDHLAVPAFFIHAANDYSIAPGETMSAEMARLKNPHRLKIYPAVGRTADDGHNFFYLGRAMWKADVLGFLEYFMQH